MEGLRKVIRRFLQFLWNYFPPDKQVVRVSYTHEGESNRGKLQNQLLITVNDREIVKQRLDTARDVWDSFTAVGRVLNALGFKGGPLEVTHKSPDGQTAMGQAKDFTH